MLPTYRGRAITERFTTGQRLGIGPVIAGNWKSRSHLRQRRRGGRFMPEFRGGNMKKFRSIRMRVRKIDGDYMVAPRVPPQSGLATTFYVVRPNNADGGNNEPVQPDALVIKDIEET